MKKTVTSILFIHAMVILLFDDKSSFWKLTLLIGVHSGMAALAQNGCDNLQFEQIEGWWIVTWKLSTECVIKYM